MNGLGWGVRSLGRHRLRTILSVLGIAVAAAMLLDMVMLSGGIDRSFSELLLGRGFQIRVTPKGTLPFDTEATMPGSTALLREIRTDPDVEEAGAVLGTPLFGGVADSLVSLLGYGIEPEAQGLYTVIEGADLGPAD
ncbi:MAG: ABC transporter permease, partial [Gemmatimonadales bacterium]